VPGNYDGRRGKKDAALLIGDCTVEEWL
jgi:hypothetical protein